MIKDNYGLGQPAGFFFFVREETTERIKAGLQFFSKDNNVQKTEVIITDKDCAEVGAAKEIFVNAKHMLCHFHAFLAVDIRLRKANFELNHRKEIYDSFHRAVYAKSLEELEIEEDYLVALVRFRIICNGKKSQQAGIKFSVHKLSPLLEYLQKNLTPYAWELVLAQTQAKTANYTYVKEQHQHAAAEELTHHPQDPEDINMLPKDPEKFPAPTSQPKQKSKTTVSRTLHIVLTEVAEVVQDLPLPGTDSTGALLQHLVCRWKINAKIRLFEDGDNQVEEEELSQKNRRRKGETSMEQPPAKKKKTSQEAEESYKEHQQQLDAEEPKDFPESLNNYRPADPDSPKAGSSTDTNEKPVTRLPERKRGPGR
ncbi:hypothetical protein OUZ56_009992 [Daphnia magna]|uniref:MULE transposase domain-containing protein n=1 Tax=Daphnia magna TaxID=35525 RepID=A0ABR0AHH3_9CRUS|nr:hypothetical protein OUZ56_009992 [Daphnia magna]